MSEKSVRLVFKIILSVLSGLAIQRWAMFAWPDPSLFTPSQAAFVLASMLLWFFTALIGINALVGGGQQP